MTEAYDLYIYRTKSGTDFSKIEETIGRFPYMSAVTMQDISDKDSDEASGFIFSIIEAEKCRSYNAINCFPAYLNVLRISKDEYLYILTVSKGVGLEKLYDILKALFGSPVSAPIFGEPMPKNSPTQAAGYWKDRFKGLNFNEDKSRFCRTGKRIKEQMEFPEDSIRSVEILRKMQSEYLRSIFTGVMAVILSRKFDLSSVLIEDMKDESEMESIPILYSKNQSPKELLESLKTQFHNADCNDTCTMAKAEEVLGFSPSEKAILTQEFIFDNKYTYFINNMKPDRIYTIMSHKESDSPLKVTYRFIGGACLITYDYNADDFADINIQKLHENLCSAISQFLSGDRKDELPVFEEEPKKSNAVRLAKAKEVSIRSIPVFSAFTSEEIDELVGKVGLTVFNRNQEIIAQGLENSYVLIILSGNVEINGFDRKRFVKPLQILKEHEVFGIESILTDKVSKVMYRAYSENVIVMSIKRSTILKLAEKHPELMFMLLDVQSERLYKFQRLWMLS